MKSVTMKILALLLATVMLLSTFVACSDPVDTPDGETTAGEDATEAVTEDPTKKALDDLGEIDWGGEDFAVLYNAAFKGEVYGENGEVGDDNSSSQVINDAVYNRNSLFEDRCNLKWVTIEKEAEAMGTSIQNEASAPTGDFQIIDHRLGESASLATSGYLYNLYDLGMDLEGEWWDTGTAEFVLAGGVYFMSGSLNFGDDGVTYVLIFNKEMQRTYSNTVPNPYETVRNWEWTLEYFNGVIQGISADNGDGKWDELDTYGFINTWEYGNTFFIGSDLRYINNTGSDGEITLFLTDKAQMEKALDVLELSQAIYHNNNASYMSPPGQENLGQTAFKENRGLFYGEVVNHLTPLTQEMDGEFGILPVPKYDKAQEYYRTWTHASGSTFSVTSAITDDKAETVGLILEAYAILSHQYLKPAYYDIMLTSRNVHDAESAEMMDLMFSNRVYEMSFYFNNFGFFDLFKTATNDNADNFSSKYSSTSRGFEKKLKSVLKKLEKD
ncbi:MAG: hypothetical protein IJX72_07070 [Clostridia bacterium]|nr:hypothetical protein [Clostridia bacterium]